MKRLSTQFVALLLFALVAITARAQIIYYGSTGQTLYARFDDGSNTAVNLTEGSTLTAGRYSAANPAIVTAGLATSTSSYTYRVFVGTASGQSSADIAVGNGSTYWNGTVTQDALASKGITSARVTNLDNADVATSTRQVTVASLGTMVTNWLAMVSSNAFTVPALANAPSGGGGATISPKDPDEDETWGFDTASQTTAPNQIPMTQGEVRKFGMNFTRPLNRASSAVAIQGTPIVTISSSAHPPTIGTITVSSDYKCAYIPITTVTGGSATTKGMYTVAVTINTTDSQTITRYGLLPVQ